MKRFFTLIFAGAIYVLFVVGFNYADNNGIIKNTINKAGLHGGVDGQSQTNTVLNNTDPIPPPPHGGVDGQSQTNTVLNNTDPIPPPPH